MILIIGSYAIAEKPGIYIYEIDPDALTNRLLHAISGIENPSFVEVSADEHKLFAISEDKNGNVGQLNLYSIKDIQNEPALRAQIHFRAAGSCFIAVDRACKHTFVANYGDGSLAVLKRVGSPKETPLSELIKFSGHGPNQERQHESHIHAARLSPDEKFLYCTDLGADRIYRFNYNPSAEMPLTAAEPHYIILPPGTGPRHIAITSDGKQLYLISELSGEIFCFSIENNFSKWFQQISIIKPGYAGKIEAGDIQIHPEGKYLYVTQRGDADEIIVLEIQADTGRASIIQRVSSEGLGPRSLAISEDGKLLIVANENSNEVTFFNIDGLGKIKYADTKIKISEPSCVKIIMSQP